MRIPTTAIAASEHALGLIVRIAAYFAVSWLAGVDAQGVFALFLATQALATTFGCLAIDVSNAVIVGSGRARERAPALATTIAVTSVTGLACVGAIYLLAGSGLIAGLDDWELLLLSTASFVSILGQGCGGVLIGALAFGWRAAGAGMGAVVGLGALACFAADGSLDVAQAAAAWTASIVVANAVHVAGAFSVSDGPMRPSMDLLRRQLRIGMRSYPYFAGTGVLMRVGTFAIGVMLGPERLGLFAIALAATETLLNLPRLFVPLVMGSAASGRGDFPKLLRVVHALLIVSAAASLPLFVFGLERLLPPDFAGVGLLCAVLLAGTVPFGLGTLAANHLLGRGEGARASIASLLSAVAACACIPAGAYAGGLFGASAATVAVQVLFAILVMRGVKRIEGVGYAALLVPQFTRRGSPDVHARNPLDSSALENLR